MPVRVRASSVQPAAVRQPRPLQPLAPTPLAPSRTELIESAPRPGHTDPGGALDSLRTEVLASRRRAWVKRSSRASGHIPLEELAVVLSPSRSSQFDVLVGEDRAPDVRQKLASALVRGNDQANDAYKFSPHSDGYTYGTNRWRFNLAEVGLAMATVEGARQLNPRNSRMWVVGRAVCYPVCYANDAHTDLATGRIRPSRLRSDLFAKLGRLSPYVQLALDFEIGQNTNGFVDDEDGGEDLDLALDEDYYLDAAADELPRMVLAAYASNRHAGLLRVHVGEAVMDDRGQLYWGWIEELPVVREPRGGVQLVGGGSGASFADAPEPPLDLGQADGPDDVPEAKPENPDKVQDDQPDA